MTPAEREEFLTRQLNDILKEVSAPFTPVIINLIRHKLEVAFLEGELQGIQTMSDHAVRAIRGLIRQ